MNITVRIATVTCLALVLGTTNATLQAAEKHTITYTKTDVRTVSKSSFEVGDVPNHVIVDEVSRHLPRFSDARFSPTEEWIQSLTDETDGSGTHRGHFIQYHPGGDRTYGTFEGRHATTTKPDGAWSMKWEGTYRYLGGSGRYQGIRGAGTYSGRSTPNEPFFEEGKETVEY